MKHCCCMPDGIYNNVGRLDFYQGYMPDGIFDITKINSLNWLRDFCLPIA